MNARPVGKGGEKGDPKKKKKTLKVKLADLVAAKLQKDYDEDPGVTAENATTILKELLTYGDSLLDSENGEEEDAAIREKIAMDGEPGEGNDDFDADLGGHRVDVLLFDGETTSTKTVTKVRKDKKQRTDPNDATKTIPAIETSFVTTAIPNVISDPFSVLKVPANQIPSDQAEMIMSM